jgi:hypothetical protein
MAENSSILKNDTALNQQEESFGASILFHLRQNPQVLLHVADTLEDEVSLCDNLFLK